MLIASQLRKENIAQYLLYMWQIEDIIRAYGLDIDRINADIVSRFPEERRKEISEWYESLIDMMRREDVAEKGHLQMNKNIIGSLADLNRRVMADHRFVDYHKEFYATLPYIVELRAKAGDNPAGEIETCFNALYGWLLMKLKHTEVSESTNKAMTQIARFIALLSKYFYLDEHDQLFKDEKEE